MLIDLHTHTRVLSACSSLDAEDLVKRAKERGLDGVCITEHDGMWLTDRVKKLAEEHDFLVLRGMEVSTNWGHVLAYGLERYSGDIYNAERLRKVVDEYGGYLVVSHPFRFDSYTWVAAPDTGYRRREKRTLEDAASKPILKLADALETLNGGTPPEENVLAASVASHLSLPGTGGSDAHHVSQIGRVATEFERVIENEEDLVRELRAGRFRARDLTKEPVLA